MVNFARSVAPQQQNKHFVKAHDLHWIKWSFSPDRWGFQLLPKHYCNTLLAFFCSLVNAYHRQGQSIDGIDIPLDWLLDRCFPGSDGPTLSRSTLQRALKMICAAGFIELPRKQPGNDGKRVIFLPTLCENSLRRSTSNPARSNKDRIDLNTNRQFYNKLERVRVNDTNDQAHEKLERIEPTLKSIMIVLKKTGVDELARKRVFRQCQIEIARLGSSDELRNLVDWNFYGAKWPSMSFAEREGLARIDIIPILIPKPKPDIKCEELPASPEDRSEIRAAILASLNEGCACNVPRGTEGKQ